MRQAGVFVSLFCLFLLHSCGQKENIVAQVGEVELSESDAYVLMKHQGIDPKDNAAYRTFLENWCENEALKAELKSLYPENWQLVELRGEAFKADLAKLYLEESSLNAKLDTIVSKEEVEQYYSDHMDEFILQDYIVKSLYLKIPVELDIFQ